MSEPYKILKPAYKLCKKYSPKDLCKHGNVAIPTCVLSLDQQLPSISIKMVTLGRLDFSATKVCGKMVNGVNCSRLAQIREQSRQSCLPTSKQTALS